MTGDVLADLDGVTGPSPEIQRDRLGRPYVPDPETGKRVAMTRASTVGSAVEDLYNVQRWERRLDAIGLSQRPDLVMAAAAHANDRAELNKIIDQAKEAGRGSAASNIGTAFHRFAEIRDRGEELPHIAKEHEAGLQAYTQATRACDWIAIERFVVNDEYQIAGTPDRVGWHVGKEKVYIADLKTGSSVDLGALKIACQLAIYAHSVPCDPATGKRGEWPAPMDQDWGLVVHAPAGQGTCELRWIDLRAGWEVAQLALAVRAWRRHKTWYKPFGEVAGADAVPDFSAEVATAVTVTELRDVYRRAAAVDAYDDALHAACLARKAELNGDGS